MNDDLFFTAKDAAELAGVTYRQLHEWDQKGAIAAERDGERGWRKFSSAQMFALMVANEFRVQYGAPLEKIRYLIEFMNEPGADHLAAAVRMMQYGMSVFLLTDLDGTFVMNSDIGFGHELREGEFGDEKTRPYFFMALNDVVNRLRAAKGLPTLDVQVSTYQAYEDFDDLRSVRNIAEFDLLRAVRTPGVTVVEIKKAKDGSITSIATEGNLDPGSMRVKSDEMTIKRNAAFSSLTIVTQNDVVVSSREKLPRKYTAKDNEPTVFALRFGRPAQPRGGEPPSETANSLNPARSDRKPLSHDRIARTRAGTSDAQSGRMSKKARG